MPPPFERPMARGDRGSDVAIMQRLLERAAPLVPENWGTYGARTERAVDELRKAHGLEPGNMDAPAARALLECCAADRWRDDGTPAAARGLLFKLVVHTQANRSAESSAVLLDGHNNQVHTFRARLHGVDALHSEPQTWPSYSNTPGLTELAADGNTPTGLFAADLNAPEPNATLYGPYPVLRLFQGLAGNARFLTPAFRRGLLVHTGAWPGWKPGDPMPNSHGCVHASPDDVKRVWESLVALGVAVRPNAGGAEPYPYPPQGLVAIVED